MRDKELEQTQNALEELVKEKLQPAARRNPVWAHLNDVPEEPEPAPVKPPKPVVAAVQAAPADPGSVTHGRPAMWCRPRYAPDSTWSVSTRAGSAAARRRSTA